MKTSESLLDLIDSLKRRMATCDLREIVGDCVDEFGQPDYQYIAALESVLGKVKMRKGEK